DELDKLAKEADKVFKEMDTSWFTKLFDQIGSKEASAEFDKVKKSVDQALSTHTPEAFGQALKLIDAEIGPINAKLEQFANNIFKKPDDKEMRAWQELRTVLQGYTKDIEAAEKAELKEKQAVGIEEQKKIAEERKKAAEAAKKAAEDAFKFYK